jgi:hypothetical protein
MEPPILLSIRRGCNMNTNDKIDIINYRISLLDFNIFEHIRILEEDKLQDGDEQIIRKSLSDLYRSLNALKDYMQVLTNYSEML